MVDGGGCGHRVEGDGCGQVVHGGGVATQAEGSLVIGGGRSGRWRRKGGGDDDDDDPDNSLDGVGHKSPSSNLMEGSDGAGRVFVLGRACCLSDQALGQGSRPDSSA